MRPQTRAQTTCTPAPGASIRACPMRSKAFSWSASVTAWHARNPGCSAPWQRWAKGPAASPRTSAHNSSEMWLR
eukprot:11212070-Lingulodinium_polyedra.AAC.1